MTMSILSSPNAPRKETVNHGSHLGDVFKRIRTRFKHRGSWTFTKPLLGHIRVLPKSDHPYERTYKCNPQPPGFPKRMLTTPEMEMQLGDLRSLLNEMETGEQFSPLSCPGVSVCDLGLTQHLALLAVRSLVFEAWENKIRLIDRIAENELFFAFVELEAHFRPDRPGDASR